MASRWRHVASHRSLIAAETRSSRSAGHLGCVGGSDGSCCPPFGGEGADPEESLKDGRGHLDAEVEQSGASCGFGWEPDVVKSSRESSVGQRLSGALGRKEPGCVFFVGHHHVLVAACDLDEL